MTKEVLKKMYQLLLTEPHAPTVCAKLEGIAREALAQPEQEPVVFYRCKGCSYAYEGVAPSSCECDCMYTGFERVEYFTTPPQRTWVGLTDEQRNDIEDYFEVLVSKHVFDAIETKLKELNT